MTCENNQIYKDLYIRRSTTLPKISPDRRPFEAMEICKSAEITCSLGIMTHGELEEVEKKLVENCPQIAEKIDNGNTHPIV